jgi:GNAT superfamily N-acetyltransferase
MKVWELKKNKEELTKFISFSRKIYKDDVNWVPPLQDDLLGFLLGKDLTKKIECGPHAFFMAGENGTLLGRILIGINEKKNKRRNQKIGYFGFLELANSSEVFQALMDNAMDLFRKHDIDTVIGPLYPDDDVEGRGLLVKGFETPPVLMNPYNPVYYRELFDNNGFEKHTDFYAYYCNTLEAVIERANKVASFTMKKFNFTIDKIDINNVDREIKSIIDINNAIISNSREEDNGFEYANPPTHEELSLEVKKLLTFLDQDLIYIARSGDLPIGFVLSIPDYNPILRKMDGKLFPFGFLKFMWYKRKMKGIRGFAQHVIPEYRNKAVNAAMFQRIIEQAVRKKYDYVECSQISENNKRSLSIFEHSGFTPYKVYRVYQKKL